MHPKQIWIIQQLTINKELKLFRDNGLEVLQADLVCQLHLPWLNSILHCFLQWSFWPYLQKLIQNWERITWYTLERKGRNKIKRVWWFHFGPSFFKELVDKIIGGRATMSPLDVLSFIMQNWSVLVFCNYVSHVKLLKSLCTNLGKLSSIYKWKVYRKMPIKCAVFKKFIN